MIFLMTISSFIFAAIVVGTWNANWFPSGRAEHRATPDVEAATSTAAAKMLAQGLREIDPTGTNDIILCLNEIRGPRAATNLIAQIGREDLRLAVITGYRRRDRFDQQQDVIATTLPVVDASWSKWKGKGKETPPRGYAYAAVVIDPATTARVYAVHLKSNYGATTPELKASNREKRTAAARQLVESVKPPRGKKSQGGPVIVAGDMNADKWGKDFVDERLFGVFEEAGFTNVLETLPPKARGTHPSFKYGDSALDYVFVRGLSVAERPRIIPNSGLSDHQALFTLLRTGEECVTPSPVRYEPFKPLRVTKRKVDVALAKPLRLLHVSDSHVTRIDSRDPEELRAFALSRSRMGRELGERYLDEASAWARQEGVTLVHTGDLVAFAGEACLEYAGRFLRTGDVVACVGNHEYWLSGTRRNVESNRVACCGQLAAAFPGYPVSVRRLEGLALFAFDNASGRISQEVAEAFERVVAEGNPIVVACHVPLAAPDLADIAWCSCGNAEADERTVGFVERIRREPLVKAVLAGHVHGERVGRFSPTAMEYVAGALFNGEAQEIEFSAPAR